MFGKRILQAERTVLLALCTVGSESTDSTNNRLKILRKIAIGLNIYGLFSCPYSLSNTA
jgi:hypothetical protein